MAATRKRTRNRATFDLERWREIGPAVAMVAVVAGVLVLTAILQVDGDVPARTALRADAPLEAIPLEAGAADGSEEPEPLTESHDDARPVGSAPPPPTTAPGTDPAEDRARRDLARLRGRGDHMTLQLGVMCDPDNVRARIAQLGSQPDLFFLPYDDAQGRRCYRACWGVFPDRATAEATPLPDAVRAVFGNPRIVQDVALVAP